MLERDRRKERHASWTYIFNCGIYNTYIYVIYCNLWTRPTPANRDTRPHHSHTRGITRRQQKVKWPHSDVTRKCNKNLLISLSLSFLSFLSRFSLVTTFACSTCSECDPIRFKFCEARQPLEPVVLYTYSFERITVSSS